MLDKFLKAAQCPRLANSGYLPIVLMCKKLLKDCNHNIVISGIKIVESLSKGLRKKFIKEAKILTS